MKCYKITYQKIGEPEQKKLCTSLWAAIKLWLAIRHCLEWSFGITQVFTFEDLERAKRLEDFLKQHNRI